MRFLLRSEQCLYFLSLSHLGTFFLIPFTVWSIDHPRKKEVITEKTSEEYHTITATSIIFDSFRRRLSIRVHIVSTDFSSMCACSSNNELTCMSFQRISHPCVHFLRTRIEMVTKRTKWIRRNRLFPIFWAISKKMENNDSNLHFSSISGYMGRGQRNIGIRFLSLFESNKPFISPLTLPVRPAGPNPPRIWLSLIKKP